MSELAIISDLAIIWAAALVVGYICVRLKQPIIAGYILAGIVIGPCGLKLISHSDQVSVLAEFGVALLLFALGVEVSLKQIFSSTFKIIAAGLCQVIFTALQAMKSMLSETHMKSQTSKTCTGYPGFAL